MRLQQWGTFSVKDHIRPRAFVAEVLLFDKLVIPRPATNKEMFDEGQDVPSEDQKHRWARHGWDPDRQRELLDILGEFELAVELPWGNQAQQDWQRLYDKPDAEQLECDRSGLTQSIEFQIQTAKSSMPAEAAYIGTGGTLALYVANQMHNAVAQKILTLARTSDDPVEPVIAYGSYADFSKDQGVLEAGSQDFSSTSTPYAMFGWEFFVPEDSDKSDHELLRKVAKLASRQEFCETRQYFHGWLKRMYDGDVDREESKDKMLKMLTEYSKLMRESGFRTAVRYAAKAVAVLAPLAGLAVGDVAGVGIGVAATGASLCVEKLIPAPQIPDRFRPAAVLYDARRFFGMH